MNVACYKIIITVKGDPRSIAGAAAEADFLEQQCACLRAHAYCNKPLPEPTSLSGIAT
jgi:hypothetical protein